MENKNCCYYAIENWNILNGYTIPICRVNYSIVSDMIDYDIIYSSYYEFIFDVEDTIDFKNISDFVKQKLEKHLIDTDNINPRCVN